MIENEYGITSLLLRNVREDLVTLNKIQNTGLKTDTHKNPLSEKYDKLLELISEIEDGLEEQQKEHELKLLEIIKRENKIKK